MLVKDRQHVPDILDCLAQLSSDEVPTPPKLAREMLDLMPGEVWSDPGLRWLDPCCKSGVFLREIVIRLLNGLAEWEPDFEKRRGHIFRNMVFGAAITEITGYVSRRTVYCSRDASGEHSVVRFDEEAGNLPFVPAGHDFKKGRCQVCGAPEDLERGDTRENYAYAFLHGAYPTKEMKDMEFDVIVGNPPYQIDSDGNTRTKPIYQLFVERAIEMNPRYVLMITPSRWFAGGLGLDEFRQRMLTGKKLRFLTDYVDSTDCFPGVDIQAGVSYFLWDRGHNGPCGVRAGNSRGVSELKIRELDEFNLFIRDNSAVPIIEKALSKGERLLSEDVSSTLPFGMRSNVVGRSEPFPNSLGLHGRNRSLSWIDASMVTANTQWIESYKTVVPAAYGERGAGPYFVIGKPFVIPPGHVCTMTYVVVGVHGSEQEAARQGAYLRTRFVRFLIAQRKISQHLTSERFAFVPNLTMDREWTDADLYERYGLSDREIEFVESQVKEMPAPEAASQ